MQYKNLLLYIFVSYSTCLEKNRSINVNRITQYYSSPIYVKERYTPVKLEPIHLVIIVDTAYI